jgi:hypothetical protein
VRHVTHRHFRRLALLAAVTLLMPARSPAQASPRAELLVRVDDIGMNHSVNMALAQLAATRMPLSASVMFACPWYQEAVDILRRNPRISVGVHLTLNSEWKSYRWGPVLGTEGVTSSLRRTSSWRARTAAVATPALRAVVERIANKHGLGISRYFGEAYHTMFDTPIAEKQSAFLAHVAGLKPGSP